MSVSTVAGLLLANIQIDGAEFSIPIEQGILRQNTSDSIDIDAYSIDIRTRSLPCFNETESSSSKVLSSRDYTVGWICGPLECEHAAAVAMLDKLHDSTARFDGPKYTFGSINGYNIVVVSCSPKERESTAEDCRKRLDADFPCLEVIFSVGVGSGIPKNAPKESAGLLSQHKWWFNQSKPAESSPEVRLGDVVLGWDSEAADRMPTTNATPSTRRSFISIKPTLMNLTPGTSHWATRGDILAQRRRNSSHSIYSSSPSFEDRFLFPRVETPNARELLHSKLSDLSGTDAESDQMLLSSSVLQHLQIARMRLRESWMEHQGSENLNLTLRRASTTSFLPPDHTLTSQETNNPLPRAHFGHIISCKHGVDDIVHRDGLSRKYRDAICVESNAMDFGRDDSRCMVVRGVCDYADGDTDETWQPFAAGTAAAFVRVVLKMVPEGPNLFDIEEIQRKEEIRSRAATTSTRTFLSFGGSLHGKTDGKPPSRSIHDVDPELLQSSLTADEDVDKSNSQLEFKDASCDSKSQTSFKEHGARSTDEPGTIEAGAPFLQQPTSSTGNKVGGNKLSKKEILEALNDLPELLRPYFYIDEVYGTGQCWTCEPEAAQLGDTVFNQIPLKLKGLPVIIPAPTTSGASDQPVEAIDENSDPLPDYEPIDPTLGLLLPDEIIDTIFSHFEGCLGFYLLVNGMLQVIVPENFEHTRRSTTFRGLKVTYVAPNQIPTAGQSSASSSESGSYPSKSTITSGKITPIPRIGATIAVSKGVKWSQNSLFDRTAPKRHERGNIGLLVSESSSNKAFATLASHVIKNTLLNAGFTDQYFIDSRQSGKHWFHDTWVWSQDGKFGYGPVSKTFDPEPRAFPNGFFHDTSLVTLGLPKQEVAAHAVFPFKVDWWRPNNQQKITSLAQGRPFLQEDIRCLHHTSLKAGSFEMDNDRCHVVGAAVFKTWKHHRNEKKFKEGGNGRAPENRRATSGEIETALQRSLLYRTSKELNKEQRRHMSGSAICRMVDYKNAEVIGFTAFSHPADVAGDMSLSGTGFLGELERGNISFFGAFEVAPDLRDNYEILCSTPNGGSRLGGSSDSNGTS